jgi:predicted metal-dependent peptidase
MSNQQAMARLVRARSALITSQPFFGALALHLETVKRGDIETMATDGKRLLYSPEFVLEISETELVGVIAHEVMHCAYLHHTRRGNRDPENWNVAADYAINRDLIAAGFTLPQGALIESKYDGLGAEAIYQALQAKQTQNRQPGSDGKNGNPDKIADPGGCGGVIDAAPEHAGAENAKQAANWSARVCQALAVAKAHNAGTTPGALERLAESVATPKIDWRDILRRFIDQSATRDFSWARPNRRYIASGLILPGMVPDALSHLVIVLDTSGSIDHAALAAFQSEIGATLDENAADLVTVICCDTKIQSVNEFAPGDPLEFVPVGGGGTRFAPAFDWIDANAPGASAVIYFTDLEVRNFGDEPAAPVLWATFGDPRRTADLADRVPFGESVHIAA